jgi:hypothetical protein
MITVFLNPFSLQTREKLRDELLGVLACALCENRAGAFMLIRGTFIIQQQGFNCVQADRSSTSED